MQNGYVESFNGRFRDECLNENWFGDLADARAKIADWKQDYKIRGSANLADESASGPFILCGLSSAWCIPLGICRGAVVQSLPSTNARNV